MAKNTHFHLEAIVEMHSLFVQEGSVSALQGRQVVLPGVGL